LEKKKKKKGGQKKKKSEKKKNKKQKTPADKHKKPRPSKHRRHRPELFLSPRWYCRKETTERKEKKKLDQGARVSGFPLRTDSIVGKRLVC